MKRAVIPLAMVALASLSACGGNVAPQAPPLMTTDQIQHELSEVRDTTRGPRLASELAWRGERLRLRAAAMRRRLLSGNEGG